MSKKITVCPSCSQKRLEKYFGHLEIKVGNKRVEVPGVEYYKCLVCKEVLTDIDAEQKIDVFLSKKRKKAA